MRYYKAEWKYLLELLHPLHNLLILWLGEVVVVATGVPWVARVKSESILGVLLALVELPDCPQTSLRDGGSHLCHVVHQHLKNVNSSRCMKLT